MRITAIEGTRVAVPLQAPILTCHGSLEAYTRTLIRVRTDEGITGIGETSATISPEQLAAFGRVLTGWDPWDTGRIRARINDWGYYVRHERAIAGIEMACLDAVGKAVDRPVSQLLGGRLRDEVPAAAYLFFTHEGADGQPAVASPEAMVAHAATWSRRYGFGAIKLKGGVLRPEQEVETLRLMAEEFGGGVPLRIDPQGTWTPATAVMAGRAMEGLPMEYLEDPVTGMGAMRETRDRIRLPFATNMCVTSFDHLRAAVELRCVDVILADVWYWAGMQQTLALDTAATALGFGLGMHSSCELGVGLAAQLHMAAVMPNLKSAIDVMHPHAVNDVLVERLEPVDGAYAVPTGPGLGVTLDEDAVERYRLRPAEAGAGPDRALDPDAPDPRRPGWYPVLPSY